MSNFVADYFSYTELQGSPGAFHSWCALWGIACALGRNVWFGSKDNPRWGLSPNIYVILVSPQGLCYKSTAIDIITDIVDDSEVGRRLPDSGTKEAFFLEFMRTQQPMYPKSASEVVKGAIGYCGARELSDITGTKVEQDRGIMEWMHGWFDAPPSWSYTTVKRIEGADGKLKRTPKLYLPCLNFLSGTTASYINAKLPEGCTEEGFGSRVMWVWKRVSERYSREFQLNHDYKPGLVEDLKQINQTVKGNFRFTPQADQWHEKWFQLWRLELESSTYFDKIAGFRARKDTYLKKVAMLLTISDREKRYSGQIALPELIEANEMISAVQDTVGEVFDSGDKNNAARLGMLMLRELKERGWFNIRKWHNRHPNMTVSIKEAVMSLVERGLAEAETVVLSPSGKGRSQNILVYIPEEEAKDERLPKN